MPGGSQLDATDEALIALLRANARRPAAELGRLLGLSRTTVQARLERLERNGIVEAYTVRLGQTARAGWLRAHVLITVLPRLAPQTEAALRRLPQVTALYSVSGQHDLIAFLEAASVEDLDAAIDAIGALDGIERTMSSIILSTKFVR